MTLVLTPETLGPVQVSVTVTDGAVDLTLRGAHGHGRDALLDALPDLRRDLQAAGLTCSRVDVDRDTGGSWSAPQQHTPGERGGSSDRGEGRPRSWQHRPGDAAEARPTSTHSRSTSPGVDVRV
jgi:flagellar hook-length control protein FliK